MYNLLTVRKNIYLTTFVEKLHYIYIVLDVYHIYITSFVGEYFFTYFKFKYLGEIRVFATTGQLN